MIRQHLLHSRGAFRAYSVLAVLFLAVALLPSAECATKTRWYGRPKEFMLQPLKNMNKPITSTLAFTNRSTTALKKSSTAVWKRLNNNRKRLANKASAASSKLFNFSDPLHAYPNAIDKAFHRVFQRVSLWEVNNADAVRSFINTARKFSIFSILATAITGIVALAAGAPIAVAAGRREDDVDVAYQDQHQPDNWRHVEQMARFVLDAIQNGQLKYNV